jgi:uncharacterized protein (TIGR03437 family)
VLAGFSVTVRQSLQQSIMGPATTVTYSAPMVSVNQVPLCSNATTPDCFATFLTVQAPFEITVAVVAPPIVRTELVVTENGVDSQSFPVAATEDQIHVVTTCEGKAGVACQSIVAHADGSPITAASPARPGETVVIYGWGFGVTTPRVKTSEPSPSPAAVLAVPGHETVLTRFDFSPNAAPSNYVASSAGMPAYLTPGEIGLYQVNVQLPPSFPPVPACSTFVRSNLTIDLVGQQSFDGAAICVAQ